MTEPTTPSLLDALGYQACLRTPGRAHANVYTPTAYITVPGSAYRLAAARPPVSATSPNASGHPLATA
jgi:hypothetical protein